MSCVGVKVCPSGSVILLRTSLLPLPYVKLVTPIMLGVPDEANYSFKFT